jgi:trans-2-enoyl-CoA reductase
MAEETVVAFDDEEMVETLLEDAFADDAPERAIDDVEEDIEEDLAIFSFFTKPRDPNQSSSIYLLIKLFEQ